ncbi:MAG TPA: NAD(P)/FAD-dependent oxidoreductase [Candidatus Aquilonibacter sp.]|nr:NAD(P)/FAD-dependent oxidoreductase [Candidatus Aquilonibacter sp.]
MGKAKATHEANRSSMSAPVEMDVLVVGAGLSGIAAGYYLSHRLPHKRFAILEARDSLGGTWDLFRYPGVRSDSDMHTLGYSFRPWNGDIALADGPSIKAYIAETARAYGLDRHIRYGRRVVRAAWCSEQAVWTVTAVTSTGENEIYRCRFLFMCSGYYDYERGYLPQWAEMDRFQGPIVHPQAWPGDLEYRDAQVVVIGSGATAVTIVPAMAAQAAHVTMLQRSPTYVVSLPRRDAVARWIYRFAPRRIAHGLVRWKYVLLQMFFYAFMRAFPQRAKKRITGLVAQELGAHYDVATHFTPRYNPWDQRLCLVPDGDLFAAIRSGRASVVTGEIERFVSDGIVLKSGAHLRADVVVAATGLQLKLFGDMQLCVDGREIDMAEQVAYKGMMLCDVPNFGWALGYTNASWTLKCELTARYVCRLIEHLDRNGYAYAQPKRPDRSIGLEPAISLTSGYIQRAIAKLPKQAARAPWKLYQNYALDLASLRFGRLDDGVMEFVR